MVAIQRGELIIEGRTDGPSWTLDSDSLERIIRTDPELEATVLPFLLALGNEPRRVNMPALGEVFLHINGDDRLDKKLGTWVMRKPHMRVETWPSRIAAIPFAAVLICEGDEGNELLRRMEPPQHDKWDRARAAEHASDLDRLKRFVRESIKEELAIPSGDHAKVKGLARYLPALDAADQAPTTAHDGTPSGGDGASDEASTVADGTGRSQPETRVRPSRARPMVRGTSTAGEAEAARRGRDRGGSSKRARRGGTMQGQASPGEGAARLHSGDVRLRIWPTSDGIAVAVQNVADHELEGDLELVALDGDGEPVAGVDLGLVRAVALGQEGRDAVGVTGNVITGLRLESGEIANLEVHGKVSPRLRLGVSDA